MQFCFLKKKSVFLVANWLKKYKKYVGAECRHDLRSAAVRPFTKHLSRWQ